MPDKRPLVVGGSYAASLFGELANFSGGFTIASTECRLGLAGLTLTLPTGKAFSPSGSDVIANRFGRDVLLSRNDRAGLGNGRRPAITTMPKWKP